MHGSGLAPNACGGNGLRIARAESAPDRLPSHLDAIDLPHALLTVLPLFDGRETKEILQDLAARGVGIEASYLRQLCDWGILVQA
ncbi:MAG: hypothetical protein ABI193_01420 [Minicystis sp.]